jgi:hypothetical protein
MPSFQSPVPISGRPCVADGRLRSSARAQCSKSVRALVETRGSKYDSCCPARAAAVEERHRLVEDRASPVTRT